MSQRPRYAVFASGSGSTLGRVLEDIQAGRVDFEVPVVITNNPDAPVLGRVATFNATRGFNIYTEVINGNTHPGEHEKGAQSKEEAAAILEILREYGITNVALLGMMKRVHPDIFNNFDTINTHPGLLPFSAGLIGIEVQKKVLREGQLEAGQTLHYVVEEYDAGATLIEHKIPVRPDHTPETLFADVQVVEKEFIGPDMDAHAKGILV